MNESIEELAGIIRSEIGVQGKMASSLSQQQEILVKSRWEDLEANLARLEDLRLQAETLSAKRVSEKGKVASRFGLEAGVTLTEIARAAGGEEEGDLETLKEQLTAAAKKVKSVSRQNMLLIRQCIELNNELICLLMGKKVSNLSTYDADGEVKTPADPKMVDAKL